MSQNPYAAYSTGEPAPEARTSVLAVLSLVSSLICCIPVVTGALGVILGGVALLRIGASNGRRKGAGLAIAGIVIGLVVSCIWLFVTIGAYQGVKQFTAISTPVINSLTTSDVNKLRTAISPTLSAQVSDADWAAFKAKVEGELGTLEQFDSPWAFGYGYSKAGELMQHHRGSRNEMPMPIKGSKGYGMLLIELPQNIKSSNQNMQETILGNATNIGIILPSGAVVYLIDPDKPKTSPSPTPLPPKSPSPPESPKPDGV